MATFYLLDNGFFFVEYKNVPDIKKKLTLYSKKFGYTKQSVLGLSTYLEKNDLKKVDHIYNVVLDMSKNNLKPLLNFVDSDDEEELIYKDVYYFPILFTLDKRNKERMWKIWVIDDTIHRLSGLVKGKKVPWKRTQTAKNVGRKNATTASQQAKKVAMTMWIKQIDKNYRPKCKEGKAMLKKVMDEKVKSGGHNINAGIAVMGGKKKKLTQKQKNYKLGVVNKNILPMKATDVYKLAKKGGDDTVISKLSKNFDFEEGVYLQWKLDGWRCTARLQIHNGEVKVVLTTNSGKEYPWFGSLRKEVLDFLKGHSDLYLDGLDCEVYTHRLEDENGIGLDDDARFSMISSMCGLRRTSPHPLEDQMCLYVFDLVDMSGELDQDERFERLKKLFVLNKGKNPHIIMTDTQVAEFPEDVLSIHDEYAQQGYEGVIIRSRELLYKLKHRSRQMAKYKCFVDSEYPVVGVHKNKGVDKEFFVWELEDPEIKDKNGESVKFKAKPMGCREDRIYWYDNYLEFIGRYLTVKYQGLSEEGIPRFPIAKAFRKEGDF